MTRLILILFLLFTPAVVGCTRVQVQQPETPKAAALLKANEVDLRVLELVHAIDAACGPAPQCQPGSLDTGLAKTLVQGCMDVSAVARRSADGWQSAARAIWAQLKPRFAGITNPAVVAAFGLVDGLLGGI
jgi:hypothetical protein